MSSTSTLPINPTLAQRLASLDRGQRLRLVLGMVLFIAVAVTGVVMGRQAEWRVLYSNLADKDGGAVIAQLSTMNIPYKHADGGGAILVPADRVHDVRLKLASMGLPRGVASGFESVDSHRFGMTQFQERLTFQRGLEGELTRSIQSLSSVQNARVHLALPNQNGFFREQQKPSASVLLTLHPARSLERNQIAGIVHLVASSVPEMSPTAVSVVDDSGKLLSGSPDGATSSGFDTEQLQYLRQVEQGYRQRIMEIMEPIVGRQNVKAQVTAELDFSQTEATTESHKPNQSPESSAVRSQQIVESAGGSTSSNPSGVPGATTNQPPTTATAPINGSAQPLSVAGATPLSAGGKRESIVNYEVDKTVRVVKGATGTIKRLTAAVVVNNNVTTNDKGKTTSTPLTDAQIEKMTALVREAIGFNKERGDSVNLMNAPFVPEKTEVLDIPLWKQPLVLDLVRSMAWPLGTLLLAGLVMAGVIRPAIKALGQPTQGGANTRAPVAQLDALESDVPERPNVASLASPTGMAQPTAAENQLEDARKLTRDNPAAVANIIKTWINGEAPA